MIIGKTPYTEGQIPDMDEYLVKYQDKKKRKKTNDLMFSDMNKRNWPQCEIDSRTKDIQNYNFDIGAKLYKITLLQNEINELLKLKTNAEFMLDVCEKTKETKDWCGYVEEERYGIRPGIKDIKAVELNDDIVLGYLSGRLSLVQLSYIQKMLQE